MKNGLEYFLCYLLKIPISVQTYTDNQTCKAKSAFLEFFKEGWMAAAILKLL